MIRGFHTKFQQLLKNEILATGLNGVVEILGLCKVHSLFPKTSLKPGATFDNNDQKHFNNHSRICRVVERVLGLSELPVRNISPIPRWADMWSSRAMRLMTKSSHSQAYMIYSCIKHLANCSPIVSYNSNQPLCQSKVPPPPCHVNCGGCLSLLCHAGQCEIVN